MLSNLASSNFWGSILAVAPIGVNCVDKLGVNFLESWCECDERTYGHTSTIDITMVTYNAQKIQFWRGEMVYKIPRALQYCYCDKENNKFAESTLFSSSRYRPRSVKQEDMRLFAPAK